MKRMNPLGCPDKPCDCGCPDCYDPKGAAAASVTTEVVNPERVSSGYSKPSIEDYLTVQETKVTADHNSGYEKKAKPHVARLIPSGYNKKEIVKVEPLKETEKVCEKSKEDNTGFCIAGIGFGLLLLLGLLSRDDDEKKRSS